jgi:hypothetical protein
MKYLKTCSLKPKWNYLLQFFETLHDYVEFYFFPKCFLKARASVIKSSKTQIRWLLEKTKNHPTLHCITNKMWPTISITCLTPPLSPFLPPQIFLKIGTWDVFQNKKYKPNSTPPHPNYFSKKSLLLLFKILIFFLKLTMCLTPEYFFKK